MFSDGEIRINTKIDMAGFKSGMDKMVAEWGKLANDPKGQAQFAKGMRDGFLETGKAVDGVTGRVRKLSGFQSILVSIGGLFRSIGMNISQLGIPFLGQAFISLGGGIRSAALGMKLFETATNGATVATGIFQTVASAGLVVLLAALAILTLGLIALVATVAFSIKSFIGLDNSVQGLKDSVADLKNAFAIAFAPLVQLVIPYIQAVISWLIKMLNTVAMVVAALLGQKQVWQAIEGGTAASAANAKKLAENTEKAKKEARGALAAFDQIDVLQKPPIAPVPAPETGLLDPLKFELKTVPDDIIKKWAPVGQFFKDLWAQVLDGWNNIWHDPAKAWENFKANFRIAWGVLWTFVSEQANNAWLTIQNWWKIAGVWFKANVTDPIAAWFKQAAVDIQTRLLQAGENIKTWWIGLGPWFQTNVIDPVVHWFTEAWETITQKTVDAWNGLVNIWTGAPSWFSVHVTQPIKDFFSTAWTNIRQWSTDAWNGIVSTWTGAPAWFSGKWEEIKTSVHSALDSIRTSWQDTFTGITSWVKLQINTVIGFINSMVQRVVNGINAVINSLNAIQIDIPSFLGSEPISFGLDLRHVTAPQIPYLATGAVIPPNAAFAAVLGDQRSGTNIEAPADLIRQIVQEEVAKAPPQTVTINFAGGMAQLVRQLKPYIDKENVRVGPSLVTRGAGGAG